jgi:hypothetical protein
MIDSIKKIYPDANMMMWATESRDSAHPSASVPPGYTNHATSTYGFKVHCVRNCIDAGYKKVIFLDAAMTLQAPLDSIMSLAHKHGVLATVGGAELQNVTSDRCLEFIEKTREDVTGIQMVGGSIYVFDFTNPVAMKVFEYWENLEHNGMFGSEEDHSRGRLQGHRQDETCMALAMHEYGIPIVGYDEIGYRGIGADGDENAPFIFYKLHGRDIVEVHDHSFIQHLIPIKGNVLDLGCRDFITTKWFKDREYNVHSVDIGDFEGDYHRLAIGHENKKVGVSKERWPDATHVIEGDEIEMVTLNEFNRRVGIDHWDLIIMDIECCEYELLKRAKHPIAKQISVEFHAHFGQTKEQLDELLNMLSEYYIIRNRVWEEKHHAGFNYWDVILIAK